MKIEQLIVQHLYKNKQVSIQGIGLIYLNPSVMLPSENDKDFTMPENAFTFEYNLKAGEDLSLIDFIVEQTRKIKPLATSDLESYSILAKQFLNIGKPLVIEGVGTIQKNQAGNYEFIAGSFITPKIDDIPKQLKEKNEENISFESESKTDHSRRNLMIVALVLVLALGALSVYYFISNKKPAIAEVVTLIPVVKDSVVMDSLKPVAIDSNNLSPVALAVLKDSNSFTIVLKEYNNLVAANKALKTLQDYGHKVILESADTTHYKITMPFTRPISDTLRAMDSLRKFFGGKPYVLIK